MTPTLLVALLSSQVQFKEENVRTGYKADIINCSGVGITCVGASFVGGQATITVTGLTADGGTFLGSPIDATYITQTANATLTAEQAMGALATGLVINTTTTGVQSIYAGAACSPNLFTTGVGSSGALTCTQPAFSNLSGAAVDGQIPDSITVTLAATATALAANPSDCAGGQYATGIAASGNLTCDAVSYATSAGTANYLGAGATTCGANTWVNAIANTGLGTCAQPAFSDLSGAATDSQVPNSITIDLAATATALAANPSDCAVGQFATGIAASGNLTCDVVPNLSGTNTGDQTDTCGAGSWITTLAAGTGSTCSSELYVGTVTSVTGTAPIASSGGTTPAIGCTAADSTTVGCIKAPPDCTGNKVLQYEAATGWHCECLVDATTSGC